MMPLRCSDIIHGFSDFHTRVLRRECFGLKGHSLNEQFDVPSDWEKQHFVMVFHSRLKRIFTTMCFLVLVGIEQGLPFKGIPAKFTTITTQHPPIYLNLTGEIQMLSLLAQCSGTFNTVILVFAPCSYMRLTNSQQANSGWQIHSRMSWSLCCLSLKLLWFGESLLTSVRPEGAFSNFSLPSTLQHIIALCSIHTEICLLGRKLPLQSC